MQTLCPAGVDFATEASWLALTDTDHLVSSAHEDLRPRAKSWHSLSTLDLERHQTRGVQFIFVVAGLSDIRKSNYSVVDGTITV